MGWPYRFVDLTETQKHTRRELLDYWTLVAELSQLFPLFVLQLYFAAVWLQSKRRRNGGIDRGDDTPRSPHTAEASPRVDSSWSLHNVRLACRRFKWWCGESVELSLAGEEWSFGYRGDVLLAIGWMAWLLFCCFIRTGDDYLHLTKRVGGVAAAQLPLQYLLAVKTPYSPLQRLTRCSHETLNLLHQHLGGIVSALLTLHAALYLNFYIQSSLLLAKLTQGYILAGVAGIMAFVTIATTALAPVRRRRYRLFYTIHVTLATSLLPVLFFHVRQLRPYLYQAGLIAILNPLLRYLSTHRLPGLPRLLPGTRNLTEIDIRFPPHTDKTSAFATWHAGQHAYISLSSHSLLAPFHSNPFTVASLPSIDGHLRFIARTGVAGANTAKLTRYHHHDSPATKTPLLTIEGPYGVATHAARLLQYDRVLFVAGGVGATFILPLYRQLLADLSPSKGSHRRQKVTLIWSARKAEEVAWGLPRDPRQREGFVERARVYITGGSTAANNDDGVGSLAQQKLHEEGEEAIVEQDYAADAIELEERKNLLAASDDAHVPSGGDEAVSLSILTAAGLSVSPGRPPLARLVVQTFAHPPTEKVAVVVCGPRSLGRALRREVTPFVWRGREVWFWDEKFSM